MTIRAALDGSESSYEVGKFYRVPGVKTVKRLREGYIPLWLGEWVPVMGPLHRDAGVVKFPWLHWHVDLRFVSERLFKRMSSPNGTPYEFPLQKHPLTFKGAEDETDTFLSGPLETRLRKCQRELPAFPTNKAKWLPALQQECAALKMTNMVCPHRGIPLDRCPRDGDVVQCPGHGLRWNVTTGELVK